MNRRQFLHFAAGSSLGALVTGGAAAWRIDHEAHRPAIPTGVDAILPRPDLLTLEEVLRAPNLTRHLAAAYGQTGNPARDLALYLQSVVHMAQPYGAAPSIPNVEAFLELTRAHCGDYLVALADLCGRFGLTTRRREFADNFHGWVEVQIDGAWELFDATTNVWVNQPMDALLDGVPRRYRMLYAPVTDPTAPEVYRAHLREGYDVGALRARLPFFGKVAGGVSSAPLVSKAKGYL